MNQPWKSDPNAVTPAEAISSAIQDLMASRLGRGFLPLGLVVVVGALQLGLGGETPASIALIGGAVAAGATMLGYGLRVTQLALGGEERVWMNFMMWMSIVPPLFALYLFAWRGLRGFVVGGGLSGVLGAVFFTFAGAWAMRTWMKVVEVERLAEVMLTALPTDGER